MTLSIIILGVFLGLCLYGLLTTSIKVLITLYQMHVFKKAMNSFKSSILDGIQEDTHNNSRNTTH